MGLPFENYQRFCTQNTLAVGDATKVLMAAVSGVTYFVTSVCVTCLVSAAQTVYVGDSSGTVKALSLPASFTAGAQAFTQLLHGLQLTKSQALSITPAAAGPSFHVVVEGYLKREDAALVS